VLDTIIVVRERRTRVVRRVYEDAFNLSRELLFERLEREEVVAKDQPVGEDVALPVSSTRMRGSSFGRFSLPIQVSSSLVL
jgi:hypothetical protein